MRLAAVETTSTTSVDYPRMSWDVFISHASEDKASVARPLAEKLRQEGFSVWLDENELFIGDSLRTKIDQGLAESRFGVVIISPAFFSKDWPQRELNGLAARETARQKVIMPIWHDIEHDTVAKYSPTLADKLAVHTSQGIDVVSNAIIAAIRADSRSTKHSGTGVWPYPRIPTNIFELLTPKVTIGRMKQLFGPAQREGRPMEAALGMVNNFTRFIGQGEVELHPENTERQFGYKFEDAFVQIKSKHGESISELMVVGRNPKQPVKAPVYPLQEVVLGATPLASLHGSDELQNDHSSKHWGVFTQQYYGMPGHYLHYVLGQLEAPYVELPDDGSINWAGVSIEKLDIPYFEWSYFL
jgi:TIR domain